ncbi:hypothetical protein BDP27DRAFT_1313613 [Rhodocollybia butyracea]|uniref:MARVEL domain-containing protein n=1 Tax=Rhodocollybia butyracea TaxID=206335 RepID=A0A9P5Q1J4_9AGAR|nr:hypothetical protein BDP27DRAFT_1313613 [Rhodocollybia butyracea]
MALLPTLRIVVRTFVLLCSIVVLGLAAHVTSLADFDGFDFAGLAIAVAVITIISLNAMIAIDYTRRGAFTSMVIVELGWFSVLWILWLSAAALSAEEICVAFDSFDFDPVLNTICGENHAITAFSFLAWLCLLGYTITLLSYAIMSANRGGNPWMTAVNDGLLTAPQSGIPASGFDSEKQNSTSGAATTYTPPAQVYNSPQGLQHAYPPQQQQQQYQQPPRVAQV